MGEYISLSMEVMLHPAICTADIQYFSSNYVDMYCKAIYQVPSVVVTFDKIM